MKHIEQWIWLPIEKYGNKPHNILSGFENIDGQDFVVAEFLRSLIFPRK